MGGVCWAAGAAGMGVNEGVDAVVDGDATRRAHERHALAFVSQMGFEMLDHIGEDMNLGVSAGCWLL